MVGRGQTPRLPRSCMRKVLLRTTMSSSSAVINTARGRPYSPVGEEIDTTLCGQTVRSLGLLCTCLCCVRRPTDKICGVQLLLSPRKARSAAFPSRCICDCRAHARYLFVSSTRFGGNPFLADTAETPMSDENIQDEYATRFKFDYSGHCCLSCPICCSYAELRESAHCWRSSKAGPRRMERGRSRQVIRQYRHLLR